MDYAQRIKNLREDKDMNQTQIAELLHVGQKTYSDYERRNCRIPVDSLIILAKFYNVDMNYICGVSDARHSFPVKNGAL